MVPGASAQTLTTTRVAFGLSRPLFVTHAPRDFTRAFIVESRNGTTGRVRILQLPGNTLLATPFLSVPGVANSDSEQGLLGLAFHPNYASNGYVYVNYTRPGGSFGNGQTVVERYTRSVGDPNVADPASGQILLVLDKPQTNHNGGWMSFGPDGYLYIATGDGGNGGDTGTGHTAAIGNAQDMSKLLGKILRIDVNGADAFPGDANRNYAIPSNNPFVSVAGAMPEIWAFGVRNPWRNSFDRATGDLYIADVGQDQWEEINFERATTPGALPGQSNYYGGRNYGWRCYEGNSTYNTSNCPAAGTMTSPFLVYGHSSMVPPTNATGCAITGGVVYRGCAIPSLNGTYFFSDSCSSKIFSLSPNGSGGYTNFVDRTTELDPPGSQSITSIASFGEDAFGEVYICELTGEVFKIVPTAAIIDCNSNGRSDMCDIAAGTSRDINRDTVPDECRCPADWDGNGSFEPIDVALFVSTWLVSLQTQNLNGDYDGNGVVEPADIGQFVSGWFNGLSGGC